MIPLELYRLFPEIKYIGVVDEQNADCAFTPYTIFVLETRLYPLIYKMFPNIEIILKSVFNKEKNRMDMYLEICKLENTENPLVISKEVDITEEQKKIILDKIYEIRSVYPDYALIDANELYFVSNVNTVRSKNTHSLYHNKIPFSYFSKMLQYTGIDSSYNPFIRPEGIYLTFNPKSDYKTAYYDVCKFLTSRINEFYERGAVILANEVDMKTKEELILNWKLIPLDDEEIVHTFFEPNWTDYRFARNKVDFLTRKIEGDSYIYFAVPDNLVKRHAIAKGLLSLDLDAIFEGSYLKIKAKNIDEAQKIADVVSKASSFYGRVLVISTKTIAELYLYFEYGYQKYGKEETRELSVSYLYNNLYMFSMLLTEKEFTPLDDLRLKFHDYAIEQLTEATRITKLKNISPYSIIEEEFSNKK